MRPRISFAARAFTMESLMSGPLLLRTHCELLSPLLELPTPPASGAFDVITPAAKQRQNLRLAFLLRARFKQSATKSCYEQKNSKLPMRYCDFVTSRRL